MTSTSRVTYINSKMRPICKVCNKNLRAPAYYRNGKRYFRARCSACIATNKQLTKPKPRWEEKGYKKKNNCDLCGYRSQYSSQITVWHIDGNLNNCELINLRSVCLNCVEVVKRKQTTWKVGGLEVDY